MQLERRASRRWTWCAGSPTRPRERNPELSPVLQSRARALAPELLLNARTLAAGVFAGMHASSRPGAGAEFSEFDVYRPGDDLRHLDWRRLAREGEAVVRRHESERRGRAVIVVDLTGSMAFGEGPRDKADLARLLGLTVAIAHLGRGDRVRLRVVSDVEYLREPGVGGAGAQEVAELLVATEAKGDRPLAPVLREEMAQVRRGSFVWLISDFLDQPGWSEALGGGLDPERLDLRSCQVVDDLERDFPYSDNARFVGLEGGGQLLVDPLAVREAYLEAFAAHTKTVATALRGLGAAHVTALTSEEPSALLDRWTWERRS